MAVARRTDCVAEFGRSWCPGPNDQLHLILTMTPIKVSVHTPACLLRGGGGTKNLICIDWRMFLSKVLCGPERFICTGQAFYVVEYFVSLRRFRSATDTDRNWMWV